ncbi:MAG: hypothetical protein Q9188_002136 [Gyalolechia gomerana]
MQLQPRKDDNADCVVAQILVLTHPGITEITTALRHMSSAGEYQLEAHWTETILKKESQAKANAALLTFPYYNNYVDLVKMELNAIASVTKGAKPRKYAVLGSGPLPMTSICILRASRNDCEAVTVDNFDYDPWAISESSKLCCHTGYSQEEIGHHCVDVESEDYDLRSFHVVYLASLVGITSETKQRTIIRIMKQMSPGALLVLRSAHSLRSLLYPVVEINTTLTSLGLTPLLVVHPYDHIVNSVVICQIGPSVSPTLDDKKSESGRGKADSARKYLFARGLSVQQSLLLRAQTLLILPTVYCQNAPSSSKRGLVYVPNDKHRSDDSIWVSDTSDLTWYYNYLSTPSPVFDNATQLQFVPMLWGPSTTFLSDVKSQIDSGANISYVLGFNEPDGGGATGGSAMPADMAAEIWQREMEPLKDMGVKLGGPAVTGSPNGFVWLQNFFTACNGNCSVDFIPVHWYGNFEGLASHVGQVRGTYQNLTMWVTEYANNNVDLKESQSFYNQSSQFFDRIDYITHYSYFGSFRSSVSNVGPNAAMLTEKGELTDIGSWYLGGSATGNTPRGAAGRSVVFAGSGIVVLLASIWSAL